MLAAVQAHPSKASWDVDMHLRGEPTEGVPNGAQRGTLLSQSAPSGGNYNTSESRQGCGGLKRGRSGPLGCRWGGCLTPKALSLRASFDHQQPISRVYRLILDCDCWGYPVFALHLIFWGFSLQVSGHRESQNSYPYCEP